MSMSEKHGFDSTNRRSVIKATAGLAATTGFSGLANAREGDGGELERIVDAAHRILERTGDQQRYMDFLRNRAPTNWASRSYTIEKSSDDDPSTERIFKSELDITIGIVNDCWSNPSKYYADLSWSYDASWCERPFDYTGLIWDRNWWDLYYPDSYDNSFATSDYVSYKDGTFGGDGPAFEVDDIYADDETNSWSGVYITPIGDYSQTQRRVYGRYTHTWDRVTVESVSVGFSATGPSLSVELSDETKKWQTDSEQDGSTPLYVHQSDAC